MKKEIDTVLKLPADKRYQYFIKKIVDYEAVWGLYKDGWAITEDSEGSQLVPFWPNSEFATLCTIEDWKDYKPLKISLDAFQTNWIPGMKKDGFKVSVLWNNDDSVVVEPEILLSHIDEELENY
ncbi:DUF2750 domain-containing protein [Cytobacillus kochii]